MMRLGWPTVTRLNDVTIAWAINVPVALVTKAIYQAAGSAWGRVSPAGGEGAGHRREHGISLFRAWWQSSTRVMKEGQEVANDNSG